MGSMEFGKQFQFPLSKPPNPLYAYVMVRLEHSVKQSTCDFVAQDVEINNPTEVNSTTKKTNRHTPRYIILNTKAERKHQPQLIITFSDILHPEIVRKNPSSQGDCKIGI
ncbi:hypothetical protein M8J75_009199 [Diaphorina citri]|nr:hypothetical protein M8J75_009199 [Diaphorina citri]